MVRFFAAAFFLVLVGACVKSPPKEVPECRPAPSTKGLSNHQKLALAHAVQQSKELCGADGSGCKFRLKPSKRGESVSVQPAYDLDSYECGAPERGNNVEWMFI